MVCQETALNYLAAISQFVPDLWMASSPLLALFQKEVRGFKKMLVVRSVDMIE